MKVIKDNEELKSYIKDGQITFDSSIRCDFNINVEADIDAWNIKADNIKAWNIDALDIKAWNVNAGNVKAGNVNANNINANNINADDIDAWNIKADNISFWAFCIAYKSLTCKSIKGRRSNSIYKCLDSKIEYVDTDKIITIDGKDIKISLESFNELKKQLTK